MEFGLKWRCETTINGNTLAETLLSDIRHTSSTLLHYLAKYEFSKFAPAATTATISRTELLNNISTAIYCKSRLYILSTGANMTSDVRR